MLSNHNNRAALITFDSSSQIVSELTNDEELLMNEIDNLQDRGSTNYYQALVNVDSILQNYQKESGREMIVLFLTDGYPNVDTPNQVTQYQYLKSAYPYITINGIQYEMGDSILNPIKEISDNQFIADMETLNNVLFDASVVPVIYDTYQIIDYIDNENFFLESEDDIKVTTGKVELIEENGNQKITWTLDNLASGRKANITMKLKLKEELIGQGGIYPTNKNTEVISKIENQDEDVSTTNTPILADNYKVIYDGNAPDGTTVTNVPEAYNYSVYSTIEISNQVPSCSGYEFKGWSIATDGVTRVSEDYFIMPESDVVIKAEWSKVGITKSMNGTVNDMGDPIIGNGWFTVTSIERNEVTSIVTKDNMEIPSTAIETWDVSQARDGSVIAYIEDDGRGAGTYKLTIEAQGNIIVGWNSSFLFRDFENVESIDLTYLDTSQATTMSSMFNGCSSLTSINFGDNWYTIQVTNMGSMFWNCSSLTNLDLSSFDTSKVTNMYHMFYNCRSLTSIDLSSFNTSRVTNMSSMFDNCRNLTNIFFGESWDTCQVTNMRSMFRECISLTSINLNSFNTSQVTNMGDMFSGCSSLTSLDVSCFDTSRVTDMNGMFSACRSLTSIDLSSFNTSRVMDMSSMFNGNGGTMLLKTINFGDNWDTSKVTDMYRMFGVCKNLVSIDLSSFNTSQVTDMSDMFVGCSSLTSLDLRNFDTSQVTYMNSMFSGCSSLTSLDLSSFDTTQVTDMSSMFAECSGLNDGVIQVILTYLNTNQVTDMSSMFRDCGSLTNLDLSSFDTSQVTDMKNMLSGCSSLITLDLSNFSTSNVTDMRYMFSYCRNLISLNLSSFDTSQVTDMRHMFEHCESLNELDLSNFDTSRVTNMEFMFSYCGARFLDMRNATFNNPSDLRMFEMFTPDNIIVKDETAKAWIEERFSGTVTIASA